MQLHSVQHSVFPMSGISLHKCFTPTNYGCCAWLNKSVSQHIHSLKKTIKDKHKHVDLSTCEPVNVRIVLINIVTNLCELMYG